MALGNTLRALWNGERHGSCVDPDETVVFYPTAAILDEGVWHIPIRGRIYRATEVTQIRRTGLWLVSKLLGRHVTKEDDSLFRQRMGAFLVDNERGNRVRIRMGQREFPMRRSGANGHFRGELKLPATDRELTGRWATFSAVMRPGDPRKFEGRALLLQGHGCSVISDIDDTIKVTSVLSRRKMLRRTFLEEFAGVPQMARVYRRWARAGAAFHYVSASPWQLYPFLEEFLRMRRFPMGTFHLRDFRLMPGDLHRTLRRSRGVKLRYARELVAHFADRQFVLVGDSGESDPEIYAALYREFPRQVRRIFIRQVGGEEEAARCAQALAEVPTGIWQVFRQAEEIAKDHDLSIPGTA